MVDKLLICMLAGIGAGVATGFVGLSAASVISPMLITLLRFDAYDAIGIALASDVLASAASSYTYYRNKSLDLKNGTAMMLSTMLFTLLGSFIANYLPQTAMGHVSLIATGITGLRFIVKPIMRPSEAFLARSAKSKLLSSLAAGVIIGLICGIVGAGGGLSMLIVLTSVLGYDLKTAVGTSVFIMTFTALIGAGSHFVIGGVHDYAALITCIVFTLFGASASSIFANKMQTKTLNRITGILLVILAASMILIETIKY